MSDLVIGRSERGASTIIPNLLLLDLSVICIVLGGEDVCVTGSMRAKKK